MYLFSTNKKQQTKKTLVSVLLLLAFVIAPLSNLTVYAEETLPSEPTNEASNVIEQEEPPENNSEEDTGDEGEEGTDNSEAESSGGNIDTEDATAGSEIENEINTNVVDDTEAAEENEEETQEAASESTEATEQVEFPTENNTDSELTASSTNQATTSNEVIVEADTGENSSSGSSSNINTGDAVAYADVLNVVNTNIVNSDGLVDFINGVLGYNNFYLTDTFENIFTNANSTSPCSLTVCGGDTELNVINDNNANIDNNVTVVANTGGNNSTGIDSSITTGDAYASANIINVANTNIVDSNYLLLVFNNYDAYGGDIVLPNSQTFADMFNSGVTQYNNLSVTNNNEADINNNVTVGANTGSNVATGDGSSIDTGDSSSRSDVTNNVNQNFTGGSTFSMLIKVHGDWSGDIFGLPENMSWIETSDGILLRYNSENSGTGAYSNLVVNNNNSATINNNVNVFALTGDNKAVGDDASITTGNAYADANLLNIVNTNVIGQNWANLIFNIYGNWSGNISFGQPDLWVGAKAESPDSPILPNSPVTYTFTIMNNGDTDAPNVVLRNTHESNRLIITSADSKSAAGEETTNTWNLGTIRAGETRELVVEANVGSDAYVERHERSDIPLLAQVESSMPDANEEDNEEYIGVRVGKHANDGDSTRRTFATNLEIEKTASRDIANPGDSVDYTVTLHNQGGQLYDAKLIDMLEDSEGNIIHQRSWPLDTIMNDDTIKVDYTIDYSSSMATGTYTNYARVIGYHESRVKKFQTIYQSPIASHELIITDGPVGEVLGISTSMCEAYLSEFMRYGNNNNPEQVSRLQQFLNDYQGANLSVSGYFNNATEVAVRDFQRRHADEILRPWGLTNDSGYVYLTTRKKINEIYCEGTRRFPLAQSEQFEIDNYRSLTSSGDVPIGPEDNAVGSLNELTKETVVKKPEESEVEKVSNHFPAPDNQPSEPVVTESPSHFFNKMFGRLNNWFSNVAEAAKM